MPESVQEYVASDELKNALQEVKSTFENSLTRESLYRKMAETAAKKIAEKFPGRVNAARWIEVGPHKGEGSFADKGWFITVREAPLLGMSKLKVQLGGLIGMKSAGVAVQVPVWSRDRVTVQVGAGLVTPYANFGDIRVVGVASLRVRL